MGTRVTALSLAAGAALSLTAAPAGADPADEEAPAALSARVDRLYTEAERATERYNAVSERVEDLREEVERAQDGAARDQARVNRMRGALGSLASAQYRSGGMDPALALVLSEGPEEYLAKAATLDRIGDRQAAGLKAFRNTVRALEQQRAEAGGKLAELRRQRATLNRHRETVQRKLGAAQRLLNSLPPEERAARERASRGADRPAARAEADAVPSARAAAAVAAARGAVGSPYAWGQAGPYAFDCSGLTSWAYGRAGVALPRTSQGQLHAGRHVPLDRALPGDLVVYRSDASHVGMYVGGGQVVHAPHPGAQVRYDPVGMMPVAAVVRP
ncbi:C40 family peptidase [Streptomyces sp. DH37]|uniref:C40 family peptidase n=1 Tax=Streptomyces sp. DH37 TaxID=3040122 RepID=UPI0024434F62|nr:C40 family peptidase [Streptomyces sp. DH37]MDG9700877.1 NlpC/P60 family protein [Streptomyces sp. DH37]